MQFVKNGPEVPERLLQAHEDGRVVLFSGAGISYPAGLPGFSRLVDDIYDDLGITPDSVEQAAIDAKRYDTALGLLERRITGKREVVRRSLTRILTPKPGLSKATATHQALLTLGRDRAGLRRIITTNFDRLFETVLDQSDPRAPRFQAPLLPVPKSRWDGIVYLHGLLSNNPNPQELDRLVLSSGDFGLAYLIERWASRFVTELLRNYTVCFIGYSIDDPVLRYMTDALAVDGLLGESLPEMFAFGSHAKGGQEQARSEWKAKNVTPILYRESKNHWHLHRTLRAWAGTYRDGIGGKESIVVRHAGSRPLVSTEQDNFVGRVLWALSDPSGQPAKRFADFDPVPTLDWLDEFASDRYRHRDLGRFGVPPLATEDRILAFSLVHRPAPYTLAPWMELLIQDSSGARWDEVMFHLARWLTRHLDDPKLVLWLARHGGWLHREFAEHIERRLHYIATLERENKTTDLADIRANAPRGIPRPGMRTLWRLLITGRARSPSSSLYSYRRLDRFQRDGFTASLRLELREMLVPLISLGEPFHWGEDPHATGSPERLKDLVNWDIVLASPDVHSKLDDLRQNPHWSSVLPELLADFSALLRDAMDLMAELEGADHESDLSYLHQPSIADHPQNDRFHDWTALIELTRDAWLAAARAEPKWAIRVAEGWLREPYPVFRRLAFFAAAHGEVISSSQGLRWLLDDDHRWIWTVATQRETLRLVFALSSRLDSESLAELERAVLQGPPRAMYRDDIEDERWAALQEHEVWIHLAKMQHSGATLSADARNAFAELTKRHPEWRLESDEREEFPFWTGDGDDLVRFEPAPRDRDELVDWLQQRPGSAPWPEEDDWRHRCKTDYAATSYALLTLAAQGQWPPDRWREALQAWSEEDLIERSWHDMSVVLADMPGSVPSSLAFGVAWWLKGVARTIEPDKTLFLPLCKRILAFDHDSDVDADTNDPVTRAINHPVGHVTEALLSWWSRSTLEDEQRLPDELKTVFTELCNPSVAKFRHGRVLLATHVVTLYRVDPGWATRHLIPLLHWSAMEDEARAAWKGFLWSPRLYRPLMELVKVPFLDTALRYELLDQHGKRYAAFLTIAALDRADTFTVRELASAMAALPEEGLQHAADALVRALQGAGEQGDEYWHNRARPFLRSIWPKSLERATPAISERLLFSGLAG